MKVGIKQGWAVAALALHFIPIALFWTQWQQMRVAYAALPSPKVLEVRLHHTFALPAEKRPDAEDGDLPTAFAFGRDQTAAPPVPLTPSSVSDVADPQVEPISPAPLIYLAGSELDVRPQPETPLTIPFPDVPLDVPLVTAVLTLYIGLDGRVERVDVTDSTLPPAFEKVAKESFLYASMRPGTKEGKAVRSIMKVLVEFESRPLHSLH